MKILQLIDSLNAGGAERMAVHYANALSKKIDFSALVCTRKEGELKMQISEMVPYLFLNRKKTFSFQAIIKLIKFIKQNKVEYIHAHGSSFFFAFLVKLFLPKIKIIWHDHFGNRVNASQHFYILKFCSLFFYQILTVNIELKEFHQKKSNCKNVTFLPNFISFTSVSETNETNLKGENNKRIVCVANLKDPKNHHFIVEAFNCSEIHKEGWSLHFIGKIFNDNYSNSLIDKIQNLNLTNSVFLYDNRNDIDFILSQANIGILASTYEGFPVSILEYAKAKLAVICSDVGYNSKLILDYETGLVFPVNSLEKFVDNLKYLTTNNKILLNLANNLNKSVEYKYSEKNIINTYLQLLK